MTKRRTHDELCGLLETGGFTPSVRDVPDLIRLLAATDRGVGREAERALARLGTAVLPRLADFAGDPDPRVRGGVVRVTARALAAAPGADAPAWLLDALRDADVYPRRHAAAALGKLAGAARREAFEAALLACWETEGDPGVRRAIVTSLGRLGSPRAAPLLREVAAEEGLVGEAAGRAGIVLARDAARATPSSIDPDAPARGPVEIALFCRAGLEEVLLDEARENAALSRARVAPGGGRVVALLQGKLGDLWATRTLTRFAILLPPVPVEGKAERALAVALSSPAAREALATWTRGTVRYRIAWARGHRRAATWSAAQEVARLCPEWVNDPTASLWEARAREEAGALHVELEPKALPDPRFPYRVRDVPAASAPPLAAALVRVARPAPPDVVWDPFAGSGVELVERALAAPYASLSGTDIDPRALDAARANLAAAGVRDAELTLADAARHVPPRRPDLILTNPPMGRRVVRDGSIRPLLNRFIDHAAEVLAPGGRLVWLSPLGERTAARAAERGLTLTLEREVDMGGFPAMLQRFERPRR